MAAPKKAAASAAQDKTNGGSPPEFTREQELKALRDMLLIRRFEEKAGQLYGMGAIAASATSISARKPWWSACRWR